MKIIFCISYKSVPFTISIIEKSKDDFLVITDQDSLAKFFSNIYESHHIIKLKPLSYTISKNSIFEICKVMWYKRRYFKIFSNYEDASIYFSFVAFGYFETWLIKKMSLRNNVFYAKDIDISYLPKVKSLRIKLNQLYIWALYGQNTDAISTNEQVYYAISEHYLRKINAKTYDVDIDKNLICEKISSIIDVRGYDILFLMDGFDIDGVVNYEEYSSEMLKIFCAINKNRIISKYHPRGNSVRNTDFQVRRLPDFIPANTILSNFKFVVGYNSATIYEAANDGKVAISLLNYFTPVNGDNKNDSINYLNENVISGKKIFFPENLEQLVQLIKQEGKF